MIYAFVITGLSYEQILAGSRENEIAPVAVRLVRRDRTEPEAVPPRRPQKRQMYKSCGDTILFN